jgi:hypothetical protein
VNHESRYIPWLSLQSKTAEAAKLLSACKLKIMLEITNKVLKI